LAHLPEVTSGYTLEDLESALLNVIRIRAREKRERFGIRIGEKPRANQHGCEVHDGEERGTLNTERRIEGEAYERIEEETEQVIRHIQWVRLLRYQDVIAGIGFQQDSLVHFQAIGFGLRLMRVVSPRDSVRILHGCSRLEPQVLPDVESDSLGWEHWLKLLAEELA
jgi:hypothetical protein